jgi:hypothetical protein
MKIEFRGRGEFHNFGGIISANNVAIRSDHGFMSEFGNISATGAVTINGDLMATGG